MNKLETFLTEYSNLKEKVTSAISGYLMNLENNCYEGCIHTSKGYTEKIYISDEDKQVKIWFEKAIMPKTLYSMGFDDLILIYMRLEKYMENRLKSLNEPKFNK